MNRNILHLLGQQREDSLFGTSDCLVNLYPHLPLYTFYISATTIQFKGGASSW